LFTLGGCYIPANCTKSFFVDFVANYSVIAKSDAAVFVESVIVGGFLWSMNFFLYQK